MNKFIFQINELEEKLNFLIIFLKFICLFFYLYFISLIFIFIKKDLNN